MGPRNVHHLGQSGFVLLDFRKVHQPLLEDLVPGVKQSFFSFRVSR